MYNTLLEGLSDGIEITENDQVWPYEYRKGNCSIHPELTEPEKVLAKATVARLAYLDQHGALINPLRFNPDQAILYNRILKADIFATQIRVAWEAKLAGNPDPWARMRNIDHSICDNLEKQLQKDFRMLRNGEAMTFAFEGWFLSNSCVVVDRFLIKQMLADYQGYVFGDEQKQRHDLLVVIAKIGQTPDKNYLSHHANTIMTDPVFGEVRDRSNANFLWFIKFERSFKATQVEMKEIHDETRNFNNIFQIPKNTKHDPNPKGQLVKFNEHVQKRRQSLQS